MYDTVNLVRLNSFDRQDVEERARKIGFNLTDKHWEAIRFMANFYDYHENETLNIRDFNNALKGKYAEQGGLKYLYSLFPNGPVNMVSQLTGITVNNTLDQSEGSAQ